jgi:hypothetical protein
MFNGHPEKCFMGNALNKEHRQTTLRRVIASSGETTELWKKPMRASWKP